MGRKIPAKKHRGVKDPLLQQAKRLEGLKGKINAPPKDPDEQPVPRSLVRLFGLQEPQKKKTDTKKNKDLKSMQHRRSEQAGAGAGAGAGAVRGLRRAAGESGREFALRISSAVRALHCAAPQLHYPQDLEAEDTKGLRMAALRERRAKKRRRAQGGAGGGQGEGEGAEGPRARPTRTQKLAAKKKEKKMQALESARLAQREVRYERVPFGAVAHAPPALPAPRAPARPAAPRPGRRDLLLNKLLERGGADEGAGGTRAARAPPAPPAERARLERARLDAVAAYRALHKHKQVNKIK